MTYEILDFFLHWSTWSGRQSPLVNTIWNLSDLRHDPEHGHHWSTRSGTRSLLVDMVRNPSDTIWNPGVGDWLGGFKIKTFCIFWTNRNIYDFPGNFLGKVKNEWFPGKFPGKVSKLVIFSGNFPGKSINMMIFHLKNEQIWFYFLFKRIKKVHLVYHLISPRPIWHIW